MKGNTRAQRARRASRDAASFWDFNVRKVNLRTVPAAGSTALGCSSRSTNDLDALFQPLATLLSSGGDDRLTLLPSTGLNMYGCSAAPRDSALALSSSTASSVSRHAYERLSRAREQLIERAATKGFDEAFDQHVEYSRESLRIALGQDGSRAEVIFSPSGTDSQLHALMVAKAVLGGPLTTIVAGSDQTGSGTPLVARGRYFNRRTGTGKAVLKGAPLTDRPEDFACVDVPFATPDGRWRTLAEIDACIVQAAEEEVRKGRKILLQAMHASKFGLRAPSDDCLTELSQRWPDDLLVVIDACQARIGQKKIAQYLARGYALLVTGSKFFMGPPFSGALLISKSLSDFVSTKPGCLRALGSYLDRSCLPIGWTSLREQFSPSPNLGQWTRWVAALEEMRLYRMLPTQYASSVLAKLHAIPEIIKASKHLVPLDLPGALMARDSAEAEFVNPTIFPLLIRTGGSYAPLSWARTLCETLNHGDKPIAQSVAWVEPPCHVGQPVALFLPGAIETAAPRICIGARNLFEAWSPGADAVGKAVQRILRDVEASVHRLDRLAARLS